MNLLSIVLLVKRGDQTPVGKVKRQLHWKLNAETSLFKQTCWPGSDLNLKLSKWCCISRKDGVAVGVPGGLDVGMVT